jgi:hypothetical protein
MLIYYPKNAFLLLSLPISNSRYLKIFSWVTLYKLNGGRMVEQLASHREH